jgi:IS30 family transposase
MRKYRQLTFEDRIYIEVWRWERKSLRYIAKCLGVNASTISRELKRGSTGWLDIGYRADLGEKKRRSESSKKGRKAKLVGDLRLLVIDLLRRDWSPEQISGRLKLERRILVSHETIYQLVKVDKKSGGSLFLHLRHGRRRRKKRFAVPRIRADILNRLHISQRPELINMRQRIGDWERDLMFVQSRREALMTFVERKTLLTVLCRVESKSPKEIARKTIAAMQGQVCHSITNDNGFEFREHEYESCSLKIPIYFTNPYSSWEKGTNENTNGLIRQYLPKKSKLEGLTDEYVIEIQNRLNTRPRKKNGFQTPLEASTEGTVRSLCQLQNHYRGKVAVNS